MTLSGYAWLFFALAYASTASAMGASCYERLTAEPACFSRANARAFCASGKIPTKALVSAEKCAEDMRRAGLGEFEASMVCLGGGIKTGAAQEDSSSCGQRKPALMSADSPKVSQDRKAKRGAAEVGSEESPMGSSSVGSGN